MSAEWITLIFIKLLKSPFEICSELFSSFPLYCTLIEDPQKMILQQGKKVEN